MSGGVSYDDLLPLKALIKEREALHKEQSHQSSRRIALLEAEGDKNRVVISSYEAREIAFRKARDEFRRDVKDLERASMLLQQRENDVEAMKDDVARVSRKASANIRSLQDELDAKSSQLTTVMEEFTRHRETVSSEMVSRRSLEDLQRDYEQRVPKEAYDRVCVKVGELTRRMDHEFTANENVEELRHKLKRMEASIETQFVSNHVYHRAVEDMKAVQASVNVLDEAKELALEAARSSDSRLGTAQVELIAAREMIEGLEKALLGSRAEAEQCKGALIKATQNEENLQRLMLEAEMNKNMLLTQVGSLKASNKKDLEERANAEERAASFQSLCEGFTTRIRELERICADRDAIMAQCEDWRVRAETMQTSLETELAKGRSVAAENEVLASSFLDLSARASELELRESFLANAVLRDSTGMGVEGGRQRDETDGQSQTGSSTTSPTPFYTGRTTLSSPRADREMLDRAEAEARVELDRVVRSYTNSKSTFSPGPPPPPLSDTGLEDL
jgi:hypothetical protein